MPVFGYDGSLPARWVRDETVLDEPIQSGKRGEKAKRIQEWLCLHDISVVVDGIFGRVTAASVAEFQTRSGLPATGVVDDTTFAVLTAPMTVAIAPLPANGSTLSEMMVSVAQAHLEPHPLEVGGDNCGPWVRLYMKGNEGAPWFWCAGFVTLVMKQACEILGQALPIQGSFSCDRLASQAEDKGLFVHENQASPQTLPPGSIFLVRRTPEDWTHTGIITSAHDTHFETIEGNTNDDGVANGFEVCARRRAYADRDFIVF